MTDGGTTTTTATSARVGGKSLSLSTSFIRKPLLLLLLCSTTKGTTTTKKKTKAGPPVVDILSLFFLRNELQQQFPTFDCNAESASREFSTCGGSDWHSFNYFLLSLLYVIVYITSGVLFGRRRRCLAALVTTVIQKVVFVSPITLLHARTSPCAPTRLLRVERIPPFSLFPYSHRCGMKQQHRQQSYARRAHLFI